MSEFYKTTFTFTVLSEEPIAYDSAPDLEWILTECDLGDYVLADENYKEKRLTGKQMANALIAAGSEPGFFRLDENGNEIEE